MDINSSLPDSVKSPCGKRKKGLVDENFIKELIPQKRLGFNIEDLKHKCFMLDAVKKKWASTATPRKPNRLSARDKRKQGAFDMEPDGHKFEDFLPMHRLWEDYMRDILDIKRFNSPDPKQTKDNKERLLKADYHGCFIVIRKSKNPHLIGKSGIVFMETKNLFKVIAKDNTVKCYPKQHSVFVFQLDGFLFTLHGTHFCVNPSQRSRRKFKQKPTIDL